MCPSRLVPTILLLTFVVLVDGASARPRGRRARIVGPSLNVMEKKANAIAGVVQAAEQTKAAAEAERAAQQSRANDAAGKLSEERSKSAEAFVELEECSTERQELEAQIEKEAGPDHPVAIARKALEQATENVKLWKNRVLESQDWRTKKAEAEKAGRSPAEIADLQTQTLQAHPEYSSAVTAYSRTRARYRQLLHELVSANARWQDAVISARRAQAEQSDAEQKATGQARRQITSSTNAREATRTAVEADATISQGQQEISAMQKRYKAYGGKKPLGKSPVPTPPTPVYRTKQ